MAGARRERVAREEKPDAFKEDRLILDSMIVCSWIVTAPVVENDIAVVPVGKHVLKTFVHLLRS